MYVKTKVMPVLAGTTRTKCKSFIKYLNPVSGKQDIKMLQKRAVPGKENVLRIVFM